MMENFHIDFLSVLPGLLSPQLSCIYSSVWLSYHSHQTTDTLIPVGKHVATNPEPEKPNTIQKLFFLLLLLFLKNKKQNKKKPVSFSLSRTIDSGVRTKIST